jgi:hypothetical protein
VLIAVIQIVLMVRRRCEQVVVANGEGVGVGGDRLQALVEGAEEEGRNLAL